MDKAERPYDDYILPLLDIFRSKKEDSQTKADEHRHMANGYASRAEALGRLIECIGRADDKQRQQFSYLAPFLHAKGVFEPIQRGRIVAFLDGLGIESVEDDKTLLSNLLAAIWEDYNTNLRER